MGKGNWREKLGGMRDRVPAEARLPQADPAASRYVAPGHEWLLVMERQGCGSVHHVPEAEAHRIARFAEQEKITMLEGPRPATELELLTPQDRAAIINGKHRAA